MRFGFAVLIALLALPQAASAERVRLVSGEDSCEVETSGARILSYSVGGKELLWNAEPMQLKAMDWAHGGIPLCWPWFGIDEQNRYHGIAWRSEFEIVRRTDDRLVLRLKAPPAELTYSIALVDGLQLDAITVNDGKGDFRFSTSYHPYLFVGERDRCTVGGVDGMAFAYDPSYPTPTNGIWRGEFAVDRYVDVIFTAGGAFACRLNDGVLGRAVEISGSTPEINVWNPGAEKNCPGEVPGDGWRHFVCVEPVETAFSTLRPGETAKTSMKVRRVK